MKKKEVEFAGRTYSCRVVKSNEGEELLIGSTGLLDALQPGSFDSENEGFASKEAEKLYDEITTVQRNYPIGSVDLNRNHSSDVLV